MSHAAQVSCRRLPGPCPLHLSAAAGAATSGKAKAAEGREGEGSDEEGEEEEEPEARPAKEELSTVVLKSAQVRAQACPPACLACLLLAFELPVAPGSRSTAAERLRGLSGPPQLLAALAGCRLPPPASTRACCARLPSARRSSSRTATPPLLT
jgi:hypothetical protein